MIRKTYICDRCGDEQSNKKLTQLKIRIFDDSALFKKDLCVTCLEKVKREIETILRQ